MSSVEFIYEGISTIIQCKPEDIMSEILTRYASKSNLDLNKLYFVSDGQMLKKELTFSQITKANSIRVLVYQMNENVPPLVSSTKTKSKFIMCPTCKESSIINFENDKIYLSKCRNGHQLKNIFLNEFEETQKYDMTIIKCQICKNKNKSETTFNEFYKCLTCNIHLCPLCISIHANEHDIINMDKNYTCSKHNDSYSVYCIDCRINSCVQCFNEKHKNHKNIFFGDIIPNIDVIKNKMKEMKKSIDLFKQKIDEIKSKLNMLVNNFEIFYNINQNIINNYKTKERNYEILTNINQINKNSINIINKLNDINNDNDLMNKLNKIFNIYKVMNSKEEINNELVMRYYVSKNDKYINIFGNEFVKRNKYLCKIIHEGNEYELTDIFNVENYKKEYLEIKLKRLNYITDLSYMFYNCFSLLSVTNENNYNFKNITNMSSMFFGCTLLESLSTFKQISTNNVTNMSFIFSLCNKLDLSFMNNWDTSNVTDMSYMLSGCLNLENINDFKINTKKVINMSGNVYWLFIVDILR